MKKIMFVLSLMIVNTAVYAGTTTALVNEGDSAIFTKFTVSSTTVSTLSAYSSSRLYLECRNKGSVEVYVGSTTVMTSTLGAFQIQPSTATGMSSLYITRGHEEVDAIVGAALGGTAAIYCVERR